MEELKLYEHFKAELDKLGSIKRAWFTTFNLNIEFFEKYILSAVLGLSYKDLNTAYDFEQLTHLLASNSDDAKEGKTEVRVFYDSRALEISAKPKQTAFHLHPIDVKQFDKKFHQGVFHPKVILLENTQSDYWLMVSSANLTFGGWSQNRECFFCNKIATSEQAKVIGAFFSTVVTKSRVKDALVSDLLNKLIRGRKFNGIDSNWRFCSSFSSTSFYEDLKSDGHSLQIWSPYFGNNLAAMVQELKSTFSEIKIIPSPNHQAKIGLTASQFEATKVAGASFYKEKPRSASHDIFSHAKVWLTKQKLAIGSWNMTEAGTNTAAQGNNIEAGVILDISSKDFNTIKEHYLLTSLDDPQFSDPHELEDGVKELLQPWSIACELTLNWESQKIELSNPTYLSFEKQLFKGDYIKLPGLGKVMAIRLQQGISIKEYGTAFLTDRMYEICDKSGNTKFKGYLCEKGLKLRPSLAFRNIDDFMQSWVTGKPESREEMHRPAFRIEEEFGDEFSRHTKEILLGEGQMAWFSSFHAFECMIERINAAKNDVQALIRLGRVMPGNLKELSRHLKELKDIFENQSAEFKKSPIYLWMLIEKANQVIKYYNNKLPEKKKLENQINFLHNIDLIKELAQLKLEPKSITKWLKFAKSELEV